MRIFLSFLLLLILDSQTWKQAADIGWRPDSACGARDGTDGGWARAGDKFNLFIVCTGVLTLSLSVARRHRRAGKEHSGYIVSGKT